MGWLRLVGNNNPVATKYFSVPSIDRTSSGRRAMLVEPRETAIRVGGGYRFAVWRRRVSVSRH